MARSGKRRDADIRKLVMSNFGVSMGDHVSEFFVKFPGPKDSLYEGGNWRLRVILPKEYPYKSPSIGFVNTILHPNVDEASGSVCLDVINQSWSPMFDLVNIFSTFLPQLLLYPNPSDPLNGAAASLLLRDKKQYELKVKEYVQKHASADFKMANDPDHDDGEAAQSQGVSAFGQPHASDPVHLHQSGAGFIHKLTPAQPTPARNATAAATAGSDRRPGLSGGAAAGSLDLSAASSLASAGSWSGSGSDLGSGSGSRMSGSLSSTPTSCFGSVPSTGLGLAHARAETAADASACHMEDDDHRDEDVDADALAALDAVIGMQDDDEVLSDLDDFPLNEDDLDF